jgi:hypothetical protein
MEAFSIKAAKAAYLALAKGEKIHMKDLAEDVKKQFDAK